MAKSYSSSAILKHLKAGTECACLAVFETCLANLWPDLWPGPTPEVRDSRTSRHSAHLQSQV